MFRTHHDVDIKGICASLNLQGVSDPWLQARAGAHLFAVQLVSEACCVSLETQNLPTPQIQVLPVICCTQMAVEAQQVV